MNILKNFSPQTPGHKDKFLSIQPIPGNFAQDFQVH